MIPVYSPYLNKEILKYAHEALDSTWISSKGKYIVEVEKKLSEIYSVGDVRINTALTTNNGTSALHLVARLLNKRYPKINKIIVPDNVYVAAWNAFLFDNKFTLQAVNADINTWNYNLESLYETLQDSDLETTALLVVHNLGNVINVPQILRDWKNLVIIEDNCEGFGGQYEGHPSGSLSFSSVLSFFGNKNITSGEGGAIITQNDNQGYLYKLRSQGQSDKRFIHDELGYNYRMTNIQAGILYGQLEQFDNIMQMKKNVFNTYQSLLEDVDGIKLQQSQKNTKHSDWMFGVRIVGNSSYDKVEKFFNSNFIETRPMFYPINYHTHLKQVKHNDLRVAEQLSRECVVLPSFPALQDHEICHVSNVLKQYIADYI